MSGAGARAEGDEGGDGGASALAVTWWGLVMMGLTLAVVAGGVDMAASSMRARAAVDAAALAGAGAHPLAGGDGAVCAAAERLAARNDAELAGCRVTGRRAATLRVTVTADVKPTLALLRRALGPATAEAAAGLAPADPPETEAGTARPGPSRQPRRRVVPTEGALRGDPSRRFRQTVRFAIAGRAWPVQDAYPRTQEQRR